jgi:hypothetical protein
LTPVAGTFVPTVVDSQGIIPITGGTPISIVMSVSAITSNTGLNVNGGNEINITGTNFPKNKKSIDSGEVEMSVKFSNG